MNEVITPTPRRQALGQSQEREEIDLPSSHMKKVLEIAGIIAAEDGPILITGDSGTGKSSLAAYIHGRSPRRDTQLLRLGCGELADTIAAEQLYGHIKGAYTSAEQDRAGLLEQANNKALVLDDIDYLSLESQQKLLRFLDDGHFTRVGDRDQRRSDVLILVTSNKDLNWMVGERQFLPDLLHRLRQWWVRVPPLRDRPEDIATLADTFLTAYQRKRAPESIARDGQWSFCRDAMALLQGLQWPGNIRQLRSMVTTVAAFCNGSRTPIRLRDMVDVITSPLFESTPMLQQLHAGLDRDEKIFRMLLLTNWNISLTAQLLDCSRTTVHARIRTKKWTQPG